MGDSYNPFLDQPVQNPFMDQATAVVVASQPTADRTSKRKRRPDGSLYSLDPKERMRQLQEDGKVGPQFAHLGGAKRKADKRAAEIVAEAASEHADKIKQVFLAGLDFDNNIPYSLRLKAAESLLKVEGDEAKMQLERDKAEFEAMNKAQLVDSIVDMLGELQRAGQVSEELLALAGGGEVVDGEIVD